MAKEEDDSPILESTLNTVSDLFARIEAAKKKDISMTQLPIIFSNSKVLIQVLKNFTELYGSRWEAIKKMDKIMGGNIKKL